MRGATRTHLLIVGALLAVVACGDEATGPASPRGSVRVIQASLGTALLDVLVDGGVVVSGLGAGTVSHPILVATGARTIEVRPTGGVRSPALLQLAVEADSQYTAVVIDSSSVLNPIAVSDTGGIPAAGMTKLQVAHLARLAGPIDVYRRQPDFDGLLTLAFPFEYRALSGYVQSTPGDWQVLVATESRVGGVPPDVPGDTLLIVGPVTLEADQAVTVVLVDDPEGGIEAVVARER